MTKLFVATKAFIIHNGKVLLIRESGKYADGVNVGKYDVPGGRIEPGQHFLESLQREIAEEVGLHEIKIEQVFHVDEWRPVVRDEQWQVIGMYFIVTSATDAVTLSADHDDYAWIEPERYAQYSLIDGLEKAFTAFSKLS